MEYANLNQDAEAQYVSSCSLFCGLYRCSFFSFSIFWVMNNLVMRRAVGDKDSKTRINNSFWISPEQMRTFIWNIPASKQVHCDHFCLFFGFSLHQFSVAISGTKTDLRERRRRRRKWEWHRKTKRECAYVHGAFVSFSRACTCLCSPSRLEFLNKVTC